MDQLALESKLSEVLTSENVNRVAGFLSGVNPVAGAVAGILGTVIVRSANNINGYIAAQWSKPILPPDITIPMNFNLASRWLDSHGMAGIFSPELQAAQSESDLWQRRKFEEKVGAIAATMSTLLDESRGTMARAFFAVQLTNGEYRAIWDNWDGYLSARQEAEVLLPVPVMQGLLSIAFGKDGLQGVVTDAVKSEAAGKLRTTVQQLVKKQFGVEVDIDSILAKIS